MLRTQCVEKKLSLIQFLESTLNTSFIRALFFEVNCASIVFLEREFQAQKAMFRRNIKLGFEPLVILLIQNKFVTVTCPYKHPGLKIAQKDKHISQTKCFNPSRIT